MTDKEKLYETLGELIYVIAMADGEIQPEERDEINMILSTHNWGSDIRWSFNYEAKKEQEIDEIYNKVINYCHSYGPSPIYNEFIKVITEVAAASDGIDANESKIIDSFSKDLKERFINDIEKLNIKH